MLQKVLLRGQRSELCRSSSPLHIEGSVLTKQWREPHDSAHPSPCHNSQRCPGPPHPAPGDLDGGQQRDSAASSTAHQARGAGWAGLLRCACPRHPEQVSDALTHQRPGRSPLGLDGAEAVLGADLGGITPAVGWLGREDLADAGGRDCGSVLKEHVRIFTTLPGFIRAAPRADPFPRKQAQIHQVLHQPHKTGGLGAGQSEALRALLQAVPCSTCPNRRNPSGRRTQPAIITCFQPLKTFPLPPVTSSPAPGRSPRLWLGWTWDLGLSSPPTSSPRDPPPPPRRRPLRSPPGLSLLHGP